MSIFIRALLLGAVCLLPAAVESNKQVRKIAATQYINNIQHYHMMHIVKQTVLHAILRVGNWSEC